MQQLDTKKDQTQKSCIWAFLIIALIIINSAGSTSVHGQLSKDWVLEINGRCVSPNADGTFSIDNIIAADRNADFISDNCYRLTGYRTKGLTPLYCYSDFFRISAGQSTVSPALTFSLNPPVKPVDLIVGIEYPNNQVSLSVGQTAQISVVAVNSDQSQTILTGTQDACESLNYQLSNSTNLQVSSTGELTVPLTANFGSSRSVFVTVEHWGIAVTRRVLLQSDAPTTVIGQVLDSTGEPLEGASVEVFTQSGLVNSGITNSGGGFSIADVPSNQGGLTVSTTFNNGVNVLSVTSDPFTAIPGGYSSAGILHIRDLFYSAPQLIAASGSELVIPLSLQSDLPVTAWSFGLCIEEPDPSNPILTVTQASLGVDAQNVDLGTGPDLFFTNYDSQGVWSLAVVDTNPLASSILSLPASSQLEVLTITTTVNGAAGASVPLCFCETLSNNGAPPVPLMISTLQPDGSVINRTPATECGSVTVE